MKDAKGYEADLKALIEREQLPLSYMAVVDAFWRPLARKISDWTKAAGAPAGAPLIVGINGAQGSGKSTLSKLLNEVLLPDLGLRAAVLSLDDFYLPKAARRRLAETVHPLLSARGVPGTHDVDLALSALTCLQEGASSVLVPAFDKAHDDRAPEARWRLIETPVDVILFEGWCVGAVPQDESALAAPVNDLEKKEDRQGVWRRYVNRRLATDYNRLFGRLDRLVMLRAPDMKTVLRNRREQERKLRLRNPDAPGVMTDAEMARFVEFYERLTRHMLSETPDRADTVFDLAEVARVQDAFEKANR